MRIIGGKLKGQRLSPPANLPVRPTTDQAKEALFNILQNRFNLEEVTVLDLFSGTGNISLEFASRGAQNVVSIDRDFSCIKYLKKLSHDFKIESIQMFKSDVFKFLEIETGKYEIIFADPPYDLPQMNQIASKVFERNLLNQTGLLIIEHPSMRKLDNHPNFLEVRKYGSSSFSFFGFEEE